MKRTRHKRVPSPRRRALEFIAAHPDGCTEALLAAENIPADILIELVHSGLVIARNERFDDEDGAVDTTRVWISMAGERCWRRGGWAPADKKKSPAEPRVRYLVSVIRKTLRLNLALSLDAPSLRSEAVPVRVIDGTRRAVKPLLSFEVS